MLEKLATKVRIKSITLGVGGQFLTIATFTSSMFQHKNKAKRLSKHF